MTLSKEELERYNRQIMVWGIEAQEKLKKSTVLVVGAGGLGSAVSLYLVAAGVGRLIIVDPQEVELSNLNRQVLHWTPDIGRQKVESAKEKLEKLNPHIEVEAVAEKFTEKNAARLVGQADVAVDAADNWATRFTLNEACVKLGKPFVHAGVRGMYGQLTVIYPGKGPCLRCIIPRTPPEEAPLPVVGALPGIMGTMEALEALKLLTGHGKSLIGKLLIFDGNRGETTILSVKRRTNCPVCGTIKAK